MSTTNLLCFLCEASLLNGNNHLEYETKRCNLTEAKTAAEDILLKYLGDVDAVRVIKECTDHNPTYLTNELGEKVPQEFFPTCM